MFDPATGRLEICLPLPPPSNNLTRQGRYGGYPTRAYADWLQIVAPRLAEELAGWEPDRARWWVVSAKIMLPTRPPDAPNLIKACLDALSGARIDEARGNVVRPGLLWDDDRRAMIGEWRVQATRHPDPMLDLVAEPCPAPQDMVEMIREIRREEREEAARLRAEKKAAERAAVEARKAERARVAAEKRTAKERGKR